MRPYQLKLYLLRFEHDTAEHVFGHSQTVVGNKGTRRVYRHQVTVRLVIIFTTKFEISITR